MAEICIVLGEGSKVNIALRWVESLVFSLFRESKTILFTEVRNHLKKGTCTCTKSQKATGRVKTQQCHASLTYYKVFPATTAGSRAVQSGNSAFKSVSQIYLNYILNVTLTIKRQLELFICLVANLTFTCVST